MSGINPCDPVDERLAAGVPNPADETIPCDVAIAPSTIIGAGCSLSIVLATIRRRAMLTSPPHFTVPMLKRVMPEGVLAGVAERIVRDVAELPDRDSPDDWPEAMLVTSEELMRIVCARLLEDQASATPPRPGSLLARLEESTDPLCREAATAFRSLHDKYQVLSDRIDEVVQVAAQPIVQPPGGNQT